MLNLLLNEADNFKWRKMNGLAFDSGCSILTFAHKSGKGVWLRYQKRVLPQFLRTVKQKIVFEIMYILNECLFLCLERLQPSQLICTCPVLLGVGRTDTSGGQSQPDNAWFANLKYAMSSNINDIDLLKK